MAWDAAAVEAASRPAQDCLRLAEMVKPALAKEIKVRTVRPCGLLALLRGCPDACGLCLAAMHQLGVARQPPAVRKAREAQPHEPAGMHAALLPRAMPPDALPAFRGILPRPGNDPSVSLHAQVMGMNSLVPLKYDLQDRLLCQVGAARTPRCAGGSRAPAQSCLQSGVCCHRGTPAWRPRLSSKALFPQVRGRTRCLLVSPAHALHGLYPFPVHHAYDTFSMIDTEAIDTTLWPGADKVREQKAARPARPSPHAVSPSHAGGNHGPTGEMLGVRNCWSRDMGATDALE